MNDLRDQIRSLRTTERHITPDAAWVQRTREKLVAEMTAALPTEKMPIASRAHEAFSTLIGNRVVNVLRKPVMAILSAATVITGGSILSVSAAEQSLPGDFFYGLKLVTEQARLALTSAKEDRLALKTEFTGRRVTELQEVASAEPKRPDDVAEVAEILKRDLDTVRQQLADVKSTGTPEQAVASAKLVDAKANEVINALQETKAVLPVETQEKMTDVQSVAADTGVAAISVLAETHETSNGSITIEVVTQALQDHANVISNVTSAMIRFGSPSSTTSTNVLIPVPSTSSTDAGTSSTLPQLINQVKDQTTQAFAQQKAKDQMEAGVTTAIPSGTSTTGTTPGTTGGSTSGTSATTSTTQTSASTTAPPSGG